jgi:hypothetical protein
LTVSRKIAALLYTEFVRNEVKNMTLLIALIAVGWVAASVLGTLAYFMGEQSKPIHERNWRSASFERLANAITGAPTDYESRVPGFDATDAYASNSIASS